MSSKVMCKECDWMGVENDLLSAANPFDPKDEIWGCPKCKSVDSMKHACDESGCWQEATCGTPTGYGYRQTCGEHQPKQSSTTNARQEDV